MSEKIIPDLQSCLLCEEVRQEMNGNFMLLGVLGNLVVPALPVTAHKLCIFTRWCCGLGQFHPIFRILLPDSTTVISSSSSEFQLTSVDDHLTQVTVFGNLQFQQPGPHWVEVILDGELRLRFPLPVKFVSPPPIEAT